MKANVLSEIDVLDVCQVMLQRCGLSVIQLAQHMGEPLMAPAPVVTQAAAAEPDPIPPRMGQALGFAGRSGGVTIAELQLLMSISMQTAFTYVHGLNKRGRLTRVKVPGNRGSRYFADGTDALAWVKRSAPEPQDAPAPAPAPPPPTLADRPSSRVSPAAQVEAGPKFHETFEGVKRAATPVDTRFFVAPGEPLTGGFSTSKPGINPMTGKPWGAA